MNWRFWRKPKAPPKPTPKSDFSFVLDGVPTSGYYFEGEFIVFEVSGTGKAQSLSVMHKETKLISFKIDNDFNLQNGDLMRIGVLSLFKNLIDLNNWHKRTFV
jgi:hypothetical protein